LNSLEPATGILPRENYTGAASDITTKVYNLVSNANGWRGVRDLGVILGEVGEVEASQRFLNEAEVWRKAILAAVEKSERRDVTPPFIPVALFGDEQPYETLTASRWGSYWNSWTPYFFRSGIFAGSEREKWILDTVRERGGLCMGMIRFHGHEGLFANENGLDDLYGTEYALHLLKRDDVERALVSFYGKLAQGLTRDTFIGGEASGLVPLDEFGRPMYYPPNSYSNSFFLLMLRYLLIQDWDCDEDGKPDTLRLLFATPRPWLQDGATIRIERAPTAFGEVSLVAHSRLKQGEVVVEIQAPERTPHRTFLRLRLPTGWRTLSAEIGDKPVAVDDTGAMDVSLMRGKFVVRARVRG
jgi:hypothetical protein